MNKYHQLLQNEHKNLFISQVCSRQNVSFTEQAFVISTTHHLNSALALASKLQPGSENRMFFFHQFASTQHWNGF